MEYLHKALEELKEMSASNKKKKKENSKLSYSFDELPPPSSPQRRRRRGHSPHSTQSDSDEPVEDKSSDGCGQETSSANKKKANDNSKSSSSSGEVSSRAIPKRRKRRGDTPEASDPEDPITDKSADGDITPHVPALLQLPSREEDVEVSYSPDPDAEPWDEEEWSCDSKGRDIGVHTSLSQRNSSRYKELKKTYLIRVWTFITEKSVLLESVPLTLCKYYCNR